MIPMQASKDDDQRWPLQPKGQFVLNMALMWSVTGWLHDLNKNKTLSNIDLFFGICSEAVEMAGQCQCVPILTQRDSIEANFLSFFLLI